MKHFATALSLSALLAISTPALAQGTITFPPDLWPTKAAFSDTTNPTGQAITKDTRGDVEQPVRSKDTPRKGAPKSHK